MDYETILYELSDDHVATITLNRPERLNAFNQKMCDDFHDVWQHIRRDDDVHAVVLRAAGDKAFCSGVDMTERLRQEPNIWSQEEPGVWIGPKQNRVWKPLVCAVHGITAGGAFYWINEADLVICADDTTFFDPHVTYGLTAALEPIGLARRIPLGDVLRIALMGLDERMSPERALSIGLVTEIVPREQLFDRAHEIAAQIAAKPAAAIQGTVRAIWESLDMTLHSAMMNGLSYTQLGNPLGKAEVDRETMRRPEWRMR